MNTYRKCLICLEIPAYEIYQCRNAHLICSLCIEKVTSCQQCSISYSTSRIRNRALEEELDGLVFKCKFKDRGCEEKTKRAELSSHTKFCVHNPDYTPLCEWMGYSDCKFSVGTTSRQEILSHFKDFHASDTKGCASVEINISGFITNDNVPSVILPVIISPDGIDSETSPLFLLHGKINSPPGFVSWVCIQLWDPSKPKKKYQVTFSLMNEQSSSQSNQINDNNDDDDDDEDEKDDPIILRWTLNAYRSKHSKDMLETSPVNIPVSLLLDNVFSGEVGVYIKVDITEFLSPPRNLNHMNLNKD